MAGMRNEDGLLYVEIEVKMSEALWLFIVFSFWCEPGSITTSITTTIITSSTIRIMNNIFVWVCLIIDYIWSNVLRLVLLTSLCASSSSSFSYSCSSFFFSCLRDAGIDASTGGMRLQVLCVCCGRYAN